MMFCDRSAQLSTIRRLWSGDIIEDRFNVLIESVNHHIQELSNLAADELEKAMKEDRH